MIRKNKNRGFTLIELLVVVAIIGILSSVVLSSLNGARSKARDAKRVADLKQIQLALEMYYDSNGSVYPSSLSALAGDELPVVPVDPQNTGSYVYTYVGLPGCTSYHIKAVLENTSNPALATDNDASAVTGTMCGGSGSDFDGSDASSSGVYDLKP